MIAFFFLAMGLFFAWMIFQALSSREIKGRGWGFSTRIYSRDREPVSYWITFFSYLLCTLVSTLCAVLIAGKALH